MKVGLIGAGAVGSASLLSLVMRGTACEIVVIDRNRKRADGVVADLQYGATLSPAIGLRAGDYPDLADARLVVITAGVNEKTGGATDRSDPAGRLKLLRTNADVYRDIVSKIVAVVPEALLLVVTDPPDPLADLARRFAGHPRVLSSGTFLDTLRFRFHLARQLQVSPHHVEAQVVGEHGTSQVSCGPRRASREPEPWTQSPAKPQRHSAVGWSRRSVTRTSRSSRARARANWASAWRRLGSSRRSCATSVP